MNINKLTKMSIWVFCSFIIPLFCDMVIIDMHRLDRKVKMKIMKSLFFWNFLVGHDNQIGSYIEEYCTALLF